MARAKKVIKKAVSVGKSVASLFPISKPVTAVSAISSLGKGKKKSRRKQTVASIKKKIALIKAKKELSKVRGY